MWHDLNNGIYSMPTTNVMGNDSSNAVWHVVVKDELILLVYTNMSQQEVWETAEYEKSTCFRNDSHTFASIKFNHCVLMSPNKVRCY